MLILLIVMFISSIQPIMMVISLILITLFYSFYMMMMMGSYWFSYALVMIMLSGMFVIFVYMASLIPNEEFEMYMLISFIILIGVYVINYWFDLSFESYELISLKLWSEYMGGWMMFLGMVLFIVMLMVIWVSCKNMGALRIM